MKNRDKGSTRVKRIKLTNKRTGIAITGILVAFVVTLVTSIIGPMINPSYFSSNSSADNNEFVMEDVKLNAAHNSKQIVMHDHVQLQVVVQGSDIVVPAMIGIDPIFHRDNSLDSFGIQDPLMAPMHTHEGDGVIHIESTVMRDYTLGELLDIWGMDLGRATKTGDNGMTAILTVDGIPVSDYRSHVLRDGQKVLLEFL